MRPGLLCDANLTPQTWDEMVVERTGFGFGEGMRVCLARLQGFERVKARAEGVDGVRI